MNINNLYVHKSFTHYTHICEEHTRTQIVTIYFTISTAVSIESQIRGLVKQPQMFPGQETNTDLCASLRLCVSHAEGSFSWSP